MQSTVYSEIIIGARVSGHTTQLWSMWYFRVCALSVHVLSVHVHMLCVLTLSESQMVHSSFSLPFFHMHGSDLFNQF